MSDEDYDCRMNLLTFFWLSGLFMTHTVTGVITQIRYTRSQLIDLRTSCSVRPFPSDITAHVNMTRRRGCRVRWQVKAKLQRRVRGVYYTSSDDTDDAVEGQYRIPTISTDRSISTSLGLTSSHRRPSNLVSVHLQRHSVAPAQRLVIGSMNVQSANRKIDDILAMKRDQLLALLCLCETWHDHDSCQHPSATC